MKFINITTSLAMFLIMAGLISCQKSASDMDYGNSLIYMPQSINQSGGTTANLNVPKGTDSSTFNYTVDTVNKKVNVILGVALSGPGNGAYSCDIQTNSDTITKMISSALLDASTLLMPASVYTIPTKISVAAGAKGNTFILSLDIAQLKQAQYTGKKLALAVRIANPSNYSLNTALCTTIIILDVNGMIIGPAVDITSQYILNPGNPFIASAMNGSRWGTLQSWKVNNAVLSHGGVGGFSSDGDGKTIDLESGWGSAVILNGKVFQTITLPAGTYAFDASGGSWKWQGTKDPCYTIVAPNSDTLPDYNNIINNSSILYQQIAQPQPLITFQLSAATKITLGIIVNYIQDAQGIKTTKVTLSNYPKHL